MSPRTGHVVRARRWLPVVLPLLGVGVAWPASAVGADRQVGVAEAGPRWEADVARAASDPAALEALGSALAPNADAVQRLEVLRAIERSGGPAEPLGSLVAGVLQQPVDADTLLAALRALARFQSRECVGAVVRFARVAADIHARPELVGEALTTLTDQTGRTDPGADVGGWERWFAEAPADEAGWFRTLSSLHAERAARAGAAAAASDARLAGLYRRLLVSLPENERDAVFAEMIRSDAAEVRSLGFDQATRSVLNGVRAGPAVTAAALVRLGDGAPDVRAQAADFLQKLDDPSITPAAVEALQRESAPLPAASILRLLAKRPSAAALRDIAAWLDSVGPAFAPAVDAALALDRAGAVTDPDLVARVKDVLSSLAAARHTPESVELLARVGGPESVRHLIEASDPDVGSAAARAAASSPALLDQVLASAARRPWLFEPALEGLIRHRATAAGFAAAEALPAASTERARAALARYAAALPPPELLEVCRAQADLATREAYAAAGPAPGSVRQDGPDRAAAIELALLLANTRLLMKNPAAALAGLEQACRSDGLVGPADPGAPPALPPPPVPGGPGAPTEPCEAWAAAPRVTALAWLGRVEDALALSRRVEVTPEPWLDAVEAAAGLPHAPAIEAAIRELFSTRLTPEQAARLEAARSARPAE